MKQIFLIIVFILLPISLVWADFEIEQSIKSYLVWDGNQDKILVSDNIHKHIEPASLTKLMTAYVIYQALESDVIQLDDLVTISEKAWRMPGSRMFIEVGTRVTVDDLLNGLGYRINNYFE